MVSEIIGIMLSPRATWNRLAQKSDENIKARLILVLSMALIPPLAFYYGTTQVGWRVMGGSLTKVTAESAIPLAVLFYLALRKAGVPAELHVYEHGPHGAGMGKTDAVLTTWPGRLRDWLYGRGLLHGE